MTNGFSNDRLTETKPFGFLPYRLGKKIIYCNRPTPDVLWYERIEGQNVKVNALSFVSKPTNGLVGLEIYPTERNEETKWKMGLVLRGPQDQIYQFECGLDTVFAKGIMWAFCAADETEARTGEIGINPTPADATKSTSKNPDKILYCNIFINGRDMPYFPGGTDHDWRELATIAMTKCNGYPPAPDSIPDNSIFMDDKKVEKYNKRYGSQPSQSGKTMPPLPATRQNSQSARSGVTYPNAPLKSQPAPAEQPSAEAIAKQEELKAILEKETAAERARQQELNKLDADYIQFLANLEGWYKTNGLEIDRERLNNVIARGGVTTFEALGITRKHQIVTSLSKELLLEKVPNHPAIDVLGDIVTPNPYTPEVFTQLVEITKSAFADLIPF